MTTTAETTVWVVIDTWNSIRHIAPTNAEAHVWARESGPKDCSVAAADTRHNPRIGEVWSRRMERAPVAGKHRAR